MSDQMSKLDAILAKHRKEPSTPESDTPSQSDTDVATIENPSITADENQSEPTQVLQKMPRVMSLDYEDVDPHQLLVAARAGLFAATQQRPMELPTFSQNGIQIEVIGTAVGCPADPENKLMIWLTSQVNEIQLHEDHENIYAAFTPAHYFRWLGVVPDGHQYEQLWTTLNVLNGTRYRSNISISQSYTKIENEDQRAEHKRSGTDKTIGLSFITDAEGKPATDSKSLDAGGFSIIENFWKSGSAKLIDGKVFDTPNANERTWIKFNKSLFLALMNDSARFRLPVGIQYMKSPEHRALTEKAILHIKKSTKVVIVSESTIYNECRWSLDEDQVTKKRKRLRALNKSQPLLDVAMWVGPRPKRKGESVSKTAGEYMFYFKADPNGTTRKAWADFAKTAKRNDIPQEIKDLYKNAR